MWKETPVASTNATTLAGETPTAFGLSLITDGNAADGRETLELGGLATQEAGAGAIDPSSPYTVAAGVTTITLGSSKTVNLPALSFYADGQVLRIINSSASAITVTLDPDGTETIDGGGAGASAAYTVAARGSVGAVRLSATAWGSVQSGSVGATRLRGYISDGVWYAVAQGYTGSAWVDVGSPVAATSGGAGGLTSLSGSTWTLTSGATATAKPDPTTVGAQGRVWYWALSSFALPTLTNGATVAMLLRVGTRPTAAYATWSVTCLSGAWSTSSQTMVGAALSYQTNKTIGTIWGGNNWGLATNNANFDEVWVNYNYKLGTGTASYRTTNRATLGNLSTALSVPTSTMTHIGTSLQATSLTTVADASFVSPEFWLWWVDS